ncbi:MAG: hypothetical protein V4739_11760 [Pseudomonadota bacterium]
MSAALDEGVSVAGLCTDTVCHGHSTCAETHCVNHPGYPISEEPGPSVCWVSRATLTAVATLAALALLLLLLASRSWSVH